MTGEELWLKWTSEGWNNVPLSVCRLVAWWVVDTVSEGCAYIQPDGQITSGDDLDSNIEGATLFLDPANRWLHRDTPKFLARWLRYQTKAGYTSTSHSPYPLLRAVLNDPEALAWCQRDNLRGDDHEHDEQRRSA